MTCLLVIDLLVIDQARTVPYGVAGPLMVAALRPAVITPQRLNANQKTAGGAPRPSLLHCIPRVSIGIQREEAAFQVGVNL